MYINNIETPIRIQPIDNSLGSLGEPDLPHEIQQFLARVRKSPKEYEAILLTSIFHIDPWSNDQFRCLWVPLEDDLTDDQKGKILQNLQTIHKKHLKDSRFRKLVEKEKQLIKLVADAFMKSIRILDSGEVEGFLFRTEARVWTMETMENIGREFILYMLGFYSPELTERIFNSNAREAHYARISEALRLISQKWQQEDPDFKQRVLKAVERKKQKLMRSP